MYVCMHVCPLCAIICICIPQSVISGPPKTLLGLANTILMFIMALLYDYSYLLSIFLISGFRTGLKDLKNRDKDLCDHVNSHSYVHLELDYQLFTHFLLTSLHVPDLFYFSSTQTHIVVHVTMEIVILISI